jgi:hypothetical protein
LSKPETKLSSNHVQNKRKKPNRTSVFSTLKKPGRLIHVPTALVHRHDETIIFGMLLSLAMLLILRMLLPFAMLLPLDMLLHFCMLLPLDMLLSALFEHWRTRSE